jgi:outer membrane protein OmpA-like peptidoglycan-associated protein
VSPNATTVSVSFPGGSAALPPSAVDELKLLSAKRGKGIIAVVGYGDAASSDPDAQAKALTLGMARAQAMASALTAAGVPASSVQVDAAAIGRGGTARLVQ